MAGTCGRRVAWETVSEIVAFPHTILARYLSYGFNCTGVSIILDIPAQWADTGNRLRALQPADSKPEQGIEMVEQFGQWAAQQAMVAGVDFMRAHSLKPTDAILAKITRAMRANVKSVLSDALADGREALDAGMIDAAIATTAASFRLAGIDAVKSVMDCS